MSSFMEKNVIFMIQEESALLLREKGSEVW